MGLVVALALSLAATPSRRLELDIDELKKLATEAMPRRCNKNSSTPRPRSRLRSSAVGRLRGERPARGTSAAPLRAVRNKLADDIPHPEDEPCAGPPYLPLCSQAALWDGVARDSAAGGVTPDLSIFQLAYDWSVQLREQHARDWKGLPQDDAKGFIDFGCGLGYFVYVMRAFGFDAVGVNGPDPTNRRCRSRGTRSTGA